MNASKCISRSWPLAAMSVLLLFGGELAYAQDQQPPLQPKVRVQVRPVQGGAVRLDREKLKQMRQQIQEAAKKVQEAAGKEDLEALEAALRDLDKLLRGLQPQPAGGIVPRVIINGKEIKPGDPNFPRIQIVPQGKLPKFKAEDLRKLEEALRRARESRPKPPERPLDVEALRKLADELRKLREALPAKPAQPPQDKQDKKDASSDAPQPAAQTSCRQACGISWYTNLDEALKEAQKTGKPVFVFHTLGDLFNRL